VSRLLVQSSRWIFLAALVYAPWAYGSTRPWTIAVLDGILGAVIALWLAGCAMRRRAPGVPWPLAACAGWLLVQGWGMMANAQASYDRVAFQFVPLKQLLPFAPGVVDRVDSIPVMLNDTAMLGALCFAADLARRAAWRTRLWWTVALNGIALMICGLGMKIAGVRITSALDPADNGWYSFAFYFYHANAGAFINLVLPAVAGLTALAFMRRDAAMQRALWMPGLLICISSAVAANSKGAMVISFGLLIALAVWFFRFNAAHGRLSLSRGQLFALLIGAIAVIGGMISIGWSGATSRWAEMVSPTHKEDSLAERLLLDQVCLRMMPDSGFWGFGPGNFKICFPHYVGSLADALAGIWYYAHDDYLQAIIEWGYVGALVLGVVFFGGIWTGWRRLQGEPLAEEDTVLLTVSLIALAGVGLHSLFDFPMQIASLQLYAAAYLGICWSSPAIAAPAAPSRRRRSSAASAAG